MYTSRRRGHIGANNTCQQSSLGTCTVIFFKEQKEIAVMLHFKRSELILFLKGEEFRELCFYTKTFLAFLIKIIPLSKYLHQ